jgi:hypothetical protein
MEFSTEWFIGGVVGAEKIKMASDLDWSSDDHYQAPWGDEHDKSGSEIANNSTYPVLTKI